MTMTMAGLGECLFALAAASLCLLLVVLVSLRRHLLEQVTPPPVWPRISILKPLCGIDDELLENLRVFATLDYPRYELLLGVRTVRDPAFPLAQAIAARHPERVRVVLQQGEPGLNPKVNQLVTLEAAARYDILVVSDSNVRVRANYLQEIAAHLSDPRVGLVTHPIAGKGAKRLGAALDNLHLSAAMSPGIVAAHRIASQAIVVGKSMALRRQDLRALGGFRAVANVLAEDYVLGRWVGERLGKRVAVARTAIDNIACERTVADFIARYGRWSIIHHKAVGTFTYTGELLLNPILLACGACACAPSGPALALLAAICLLKGNLDGLAGSLLRAEPHSVRAAGQAVALAPLKDLLIGAAWLQGLLRGSVAWRGNRLRVLRGTALALPGGRGFNRPRFRASRRFGRRQISEAA